MARCPRLRGEVKCRFSVIGSRLSRQRRAPSTEHRAPKVLFPTIRCLLIVLLISGCGPTYPKEKLTESVVTLCKKEYNQDVSVRLAGKTLYIFTSLEGGLFDENLAVAPQAMDKIGNILFAVARAVLSSDAKVDFCVIVARDQKIAGFEWVLTRHVNDIKRLFLADISRGDFFERADFDVRFNPKAFLGETGEEAILEEVRLGDFLARQIARRAKSAISSDRWLVGRFDVKSVDGRYAEDFFTFSVDGSFVSDEKYAEYILAHVLKVAEWLTRDYKFQEFDTVSAVLPASGTSIVADKKELARFKKWQPKKPHSSPTVGQMGFRDPIE